MITPYQIKDYIPDPNTGKDRWQIYKIIKGGMGVVYIVYDHELQEPLAVKTFQKEYVNSENVKRRFDNEAKIWIKLNRHENIAQARFVVNIMKQPCLFLEYVSGGDLSRWIGTPKLDLRRCLIFAAQFCFGMDYAFSKGLIAHRDIKPSNCLITENNVLKITDFGLARAFDDWVDDKPFVTRQSESLTRLTHTGICAGTPGYMAPEQFEDIKQVDIRADIYSFGVMLYQMIVGHLPYKSSTYDGLKQQHQYAPIPDLRDFLPKKAADVSVIVKKCMAKLPSDRYASFSELVYNLEKVCKSVFEVLPRKPLEDIALDASDWANKGVSFANLNRHSDAIKCFDRSILLEPNNAHAWSSKAISLSKLDKHEKAIECHNHAIALDPNHVPAWSGKAFSLLHLERFQEAIQCMDSVLALRPKDAYAWTNKGAILRDMGKNSDAIKCCNHALELNPKLSNALLVKGYAYKNLGEYKRAFECFDHAHNAAPYDAEILFAKADLLLELKKYKEAHDYYDKGLSIASDNGRAWYSKGFALGELKEHRNALTCLDIAVTIDPQLAQAWHYRGFTLLELEEVDEALASFQKAKQLGQNVDNVIALCKKILNSPNDSTASRKELVIERIDPSQVPKDAVLSEGFKGQVADLIHKMNAYVRTATNYGEVLMDARNYELALEEFEKALSNDPHYVNALNGKGSALANLGKFHEAIECFDHIISLEKQNFEAWYNKASALRSLEKLDDAIGCYDMALAIKPDNVNGLYEKGNTLWDIKSYAEALQCYDRALSLNPQHPKSWLSKGVVLSILGNDVDAIGCFDKVLALDESNASAWANKGISLANLFRDKEAIECYNVVLSYNENDLNCIYNKARSQLRIGLLEDALQNFRKAYDLGYSEAMNKIEFCLELLNS